MNRPKIDPLAPMPKPSSGALLLKVCSIGLVGSLILAMVAYHWGYREVSKGLFLGGLLSPLHLLGLRAVATRVLNAGEARGPGLFRVYYLLRWGSFLAVLGILLAISLPCLLGALASYTWFLLALGWTGIRAAVPEKKTPLSGL